jgi:hypothetical protein
MPVNKPPLALLFSLMPTATTFLLSKTLRTLSMWERRAAPRASAVEVTQPTKPVRERSFHGGFGVQFFNAG